MDIKTELLKEHSKAQALRITSYIGQDPDRFHKLMELLTTPTYRVCQRAAWVMSHCADNHPHLVEPYIGKLVNLLNKDAHVAIKRNSARILQNFDIPEDLLGIAADNCFKLLESRDEPPAVKAFSMTILANICEKEPALKNELKLLIEDQLPYGSPGFRSRAAKVLKRLEKL